MTGLKLHARTMLVQRASAELHTLILEFQERAGLTDIEMAVVLTERQQSVLKYALRAERHPDDPERKADEE